MNRPSALRSAAITSGKMVYPKIDTDCMIELETSVFAQIAADSTHMLPPRSLICTATTASPSQISVKTPEKTKSV